MGKMSDMLRAMDAFERRSAQKREYARDNTAANPVRVTVTARTLANICEEVKAGRLYGEPVEVLATTYLGGEVDAITLHYTKRTMGVTYVTWVRGRVPTQGEA